MSFTPTTQDFKNATFLRRLAAGEPISKTWTTEEIKRLTSLRNSMPQSYSSDNLLTNMIDFKTERQKRIENYRRVYNSLEGKFTSSQTNKIIYDSNKFQFQQLLDAIDSGKSDDAYALAKDIIATLPT